MGVPVDWAFLNGRRAMTAGFRTLQVKLQSREAQLWLVNTHFVLNVTVAPLTADSRRMSYDSSIGSRAMKADSGSLVRSPTVAVHPSMEGLVSFVPPELTERTLMHVSVHRRLRICAMPVIKLTWGHYNSACKHFLKHKNCSRKVIPQALCF